jgi:two-component system response regulator MtrA
MESSILIISDEPSTSRIWGLCLSELQCTPMVMNSVSEAVTLMEEHPADLVVVDVTSRSVSGVQICQAIREQSSVPILLLTPINNETHTLEAYQAGADECIIKPISPSLFLAKIKVWLYRSRTIQMDTLDQLVIGDFTLEPSNHQLLHKNGKTIRLSNLEFRVLYLLMNHPNQIFSNEEIVKRIWGYYGQGTSTLVKNVIYRLRKKIESNPGRPKYIRTETGGYQFRR